ncbi:hypothetical protein HK102_010260, partial [Quaeritorhiza haematococci]
MFGIIHSVWQCCETVFFNADRTAPVGEDLLRWLNENRPAPTREDCNEIMTFIVPHEHPMFWPYVHKCILRGLFHAAASMLQKYPQPTDGRSTAAAGVGSRSSASNNNIVAILIRLLHTIPRTSTYPSRKEFQAKWHQWRTECAYYYSEDALRPLVTHAPDYDHFRKAIGIIAGDEEVILDLSSDWQEALVASIVFTRPLTQAHEIPEVVSSVVDDEELKKASPLDQALAAFLRRDVSRGIRFVARIDWWLVAHLTDILEKGGWVEGGVELVRDPDQCGLCEWFLVAYAGMLTGHRSLWRVGLEYLARGCPRFGKAYLEDAVMRVPLFDVGRTTTTGVDSSSALTSFNAKKFQKLVGFCERHGLHDQVRSLHRIVARWKYRMGRMGEAILHYHQAGDSRKVARVAEELLIDEYSKKPLPTLPTPTHMDIDHNPTATTQETTTTTSDVSLRYAPIIDSLPPHILYGPGPGTSDRLSFLARYRHFHSLYAEKRYREAAELLT